MLEREKYDVIIIGAGVGGLICGCYLAKGGLKVLIIEKNVNPGGYCCFFKRGLFKFDVGIHYLGSLRQNGQLNTIFKELSLTRDIEIKRFRITDVIYDTETTVKISSDLEETIKNFIQNFPEENPAKVEDFFNFIDKSSIFKIVNDLKGVKSFDIFLRQYFKKQRIKNFLTALLGNTGSVNNVHAIPAVILFKEFILDGGYYPYKGFGELSYTLVKKFEFYGGECLFNKEVEEILIDSNARPIGVKTKDKRIIKSEIIVSDADITYTFNKLLKGNKDLISSDIYCKKPSQSVFVVYLGLNNLPEKIKEMGQFGGLWFIPKTNSKFTDSVLDITKNKSDHGPFFITIPTLIDDSIAPQFQHIMRIQIIASFKDKFYWDRYKELIAETLINRVENCLGGLRNNIIRKHVATPFDFFRYTYNKDGAMVGWAPSVSNYTRNLTIRLRNFYQVGHWCNLVGGQGGVAMAASTGKLVAQKILQ